MAGKAADNSWIGAMIAMDRSQRVFGDFVKPILARHNADLSTPLLLFLLNIGPGDAHVNDIVNDGRYVGSNATYAINSLIKQGYIERRQDPSDRRNGILRYTKKGSDLDRAVQHALKSNTKANREICNLLVFFDNHCARLPDTV
jgi:DNA-binding MarR family transcriptional regulator